MHGPPLSRWQMLWLVPLMYIVYIIRWVKDLFKNKEN